MILKLKESDDQRQDKSLLRQSRHDIKVFIHRMFLPGHVRENEFSIDVATDTPVDECLRALASDIGFDLSKIIDETGAFRRHVAVFIGNEQQRPPDGAVLGNGVNELSVFPALSGG